MAKVCNPNMKKKARPRRRSNPKRFRKGYNRTGGLYRLGGRAGVEYKFFDAVLPPSVISAGGTIVPSLNLVPQTTEANGRIGRKITVKSVDVTLTFEGANSSYIDNIFRVILYLDRQCNGAGASPAEILDTTIAPVLTAYPNLENNQRFVILKDILVVSPLRTVASSAPGSGGSTITQTFAAPSTIKRIRKRMNLPMNFADGAVSMASVKSTNLGMLLIAVDGGVDETEIGFCSRIRYTDK